MLPKVKEAEHNKKENKKHKDNPDYQVQPYIPPTPKKAKRGRPSKEALKATKGIIGRPREDRGRIAELRERLLATSGDFVIDTIVRIALDDKHQGQMAALKMCIDRVLPISLFEKGNGNNKAIQINIINTTEQPSDQGQVVINTIEATDVVEKEEESDGT